MSTGGGEGMWTLDRYRAWVSDLAQVERPDSVIGAETPAPSTVRLPRLSVEPKARRSAESNVSSEDGQGAGTISIDDAVALDAIIAQLEEH